MIRKVFKGQRKAWTMNLIRQSLLTSAPRMALLIRLSVGLIFFTQGILKFTDPAWGVLRFAKIGFPYPDFTAHFVGVFEIVCGFLVAFGLLTRLASVPLLIINLTAISTTKIPELFRPEQGFWFMVSDARTDFAMCMGILFLLAAGAGAWSLDARLTRTLSADRLS
jgi:putative oxidoreductase